jgi:hypothetical protein
MMHIQKIEIIHTKLYQHFLSLDASSVGLLKLKYAGLYNYLLIKIWIQIIVFLCLF